ncbi:MAG: substrate binding domain-containing protein, partial [Pseudomonadota bacterium]
NRVICASPAYIKENGVPETLADLEHHNCLAAGAQSIWRLNGPDGEQQYRVRGNIRSNSSEFIREALLSGLGIGLRSTWDISAELASGDLEVIMKDYTGSQNVAIYAVYPCREFMPAKVNAFIEFLTEVYGTSPYWNNDGSKSDQQTSKGNRANGEQPMSPPMESQHTHAA